MAGSSFTHPSDPQVDPLTGPYSGNFNSVDRLRVNGDAKGDPRDIFAQDHSWNAQEVSRRLAGQRDAIRKERELAYNPLMDNLIASSPKEMATVLTAAKKSGLFTKAGQDAWADPVMQARYGNLPEDFERMQSTGIAFTSTQTGRGGRAVGRGMMNGMQSVVAGHAEGQDHANRIASSMAENWTKEGSRYASGMNLGQSMNVAGYMARQGGQSFMSNADISPEEKAQKLRPHLQSVGRAMQVFETKDAGEAIKHIKELTGKDISQFSEGDAKQLAMKLKKIDEMALATGRSAKEIGETMGNIRQAMNIAGPGNVRGYTGSKGSSIFAKQEAFDAEKMTYQINKTANDNGYSQEMREDLTKVVTSRAMRIKNTTGGRAIDMLTKMAATGEISQEQLQDERKKINSGANLGDIMTRLSAQTNQDLGGVLKNDENYAQWQAQKLEEMGAKDPTGRLANTANQQASTMIAEKYKVDSNTWNRRSEAVGARKAMAVNMKYGALSKAQDAKAMNDAKSSAASFLEDEAKRTGMSKVKLEGMRAMIKNGDWGELKGTDLGQQIVATYERDRDTNRGNMAATSDRGRADVKDKDFNLMLKHSGITGKELGKKDGNERYAMVKEKLTKMAANGDAKAAMYLEQVAEGAKTVAGQGRRHEGAVADEATASAAHAETKAERVMADKYDKTYVGPNEHQVSKQADANKAAASEEKTKSDVDKAECKKSTDNKPSVTKMTGTVKVDLVKNEMSFENAEMIIVEGTV